MNRQLVAYNLHLVLCVLCRYIKTNGEVWLQSNLSKERPMKLGTRVNCSYPLNKIVSRNGVTYGLTSNGQVYYHTSGEWHHLEQQLNSGNY